MKILNNVCMLAVFVVIGVAEMRCITTATSVNKFIKREIDAFNVKLAQNKQYKDTADYAKNREAVCAAAVRGLNQLPQNQKNELLLKYKTNAQEHCAAEIEKFHFKIE